MSLRSQILDALSDGEWHTTKEVMAMTGYTGVHGLGRIYDLLASEVRWGTVEKGDLIDGPRGNLQRTWRLRTRCRRTSICISGSRGSASVPRPRI